MDANYIYIHIVFLSILCVYFRENEGELIGKVDFFGRSYSSGNPKKLISKMEDAKYCGRDWIPTGNWPQV